MWKEPARLRGAPLVTALSHKLNGLVSSLRITCGTYEHIAQAPLELVLRDDTIELLTMKVGDLELERTRLSTAIRACECTRTPGRCYTRSPQSIDMYTSEQEKKTHHRELRSHWRIVQTCGCSPGGRIQSHGGRASRAS